MVIIVNVQTLTINLSTWQQKIAYICCTWLVYFCSIHLRSPGKWWFTVNSLILKYINLCINEFMFGLFRRFDGLIWWLSVFLLNDDLPNSLPNNCRVLAESKREKVYCGHHHVCLDETYWSINDLMIWPRKNNLKLNLRSRSFWVSKWLTYVD